MGRAREETINVAEAKKRFSTLLGRVAFGKETILIMRRGRPMARLIPADDKLAEPGLGTVRGWLSDDDPFLTAVEEIVTARGKHRPRALRRRRVSREWKGKLGSYLENQLNDGAFARRPRLGMDQWGQVNGVSVFSWLRCRHVSHHDLDVNELP